MNKPKRECGSCTYWNKWKNDREGRGLCGMFDWGSTAQYGKNCSSWKGRKFDRKKNG